MVSHHRFKFGGHGQKYCGSGDNHMHEISGRRQNSLQVRPMKDSQSWSQYLKEQLAEPTLKTFASPTKNSATNKGRKKRNVNCIAFCAIRKCNNE